MNDPQPNVNYLKILPSFYWHQKKGTFVLQFFSEVSALVYHYPNEYVFSFDENTLKMIVTV
jgi:hypothetical protein